MTVPTTVTLPHDEPQRLRAILQRLGLSGIVDVHTHFMPERVMAKVWNYFDQAALTAGRAWPIAYRFDEVERLRRLRDLGVETFTSMVYPHKPGMAAWLNDWASEFAARTPDCLHTATFFAEPSAGTDVQRALDDGARIFKAHVQVGGYDPTDPLLDPVWEAIEAAGAPVVLHAGSGPQPGRHTGPGPIAEVLRRHPQLALVIAHMGMPEYREFLDLAERYPRVHLDTTMAFTSFTEHQHPFPTDEHQRLDDLADRIVFGSDYPNIPYPYLTAVEAIDALGFGDAWTADVLSHNARRLLDLADGV